MAKKIVISEDENIFKVKGDGTIERIGNADLQNNEISALDKEILDIIKINSYSKELLAAYKARKIVNRISREKYGKPNYKEYVEMLMVKHFPKELEKARFIGKLIFIFFVLFITSSLSLSIIWGIYYGSYYDRIGLTGLILAIWILTIWKWIIPKYEEVFKNKLNI
jgi:hypothetical protein